MTARCALYMGACPENFRETLNMPTVTFPKIFNGLLFRVESSAYILPLTVSVYLRSNFSGVRARLLFLKEGRFRRSSLSKVDEAH